MPVKHIQELISEGKTDEALDALLRKTEGGDGDFHNQALLLSSEYKKWERSSVMGLEPPASELRRIEINILKVCDELIACDDEGAAQPESTLERWRNKHLKIQSRLDLLIDVNSSSIRRLTTQSLILIGVGVAVLIVTHSTNYFSGEYVKEILSIAGGLIGGISGFPIKEINDKRSSIKVFRYFKDYLSSVNRDGDADEYIEDVQKIQKLFWETSQKMIVNA